MSERDNGFFCLTQDRMYVNDLTGASALRKPPWFPITKDSTSNLITKTEGLRYSWSHWRKCGKEEHRCFQILIHIHISIYILICNRSIVTWRTAVMGWLVRNHMLTSEHLLWVMGLFWMTQRNVIIVEYEAGFLRKCLKKSLSSLFVYVSLVIVDANDILICLCGRFWWTKIKSVLAMSW